MTFLELIKSKSQVQHGTFLDIVNGIDVNGGGDQIFVEAILTAEVLDLLVANLEEEVLSANIIDEELSSNINEEILTADIQYINLIAEITEE